MNKTKRIALLFLVCALLFCGCARPKGVSVKTSRGEYFKHAMVIEASIDQCEWDLSESSVVTFAIGFGARRQNRIDGDEKAWVEIESDGCVINGMETHYKKEYENFFIDSAYHMIEKEVWFGIDERYPQYYEQIEITFPKEDCEGKIFFQLHKTFQTSHLITEVCIAYTIKDGVLILFEYEH